jgi:hypothetical protein
MVPGVYREVNSGAKVLDILAIAMDTNVSEGTREDDARLRRPKLDRFSRSRRLEFEGEPLEMGKCGQDIDQCLG